MGKGLSYRTLGILVMKGGKRGGKEKHRCNCLTILISCMRLYDLVGRFVFGYSNTQNVTGEFCEDQGQNVGFLLSSPGGLG